MRSLRVVVADRPADYARLRDRYPHAYDAWDTWTLDRLRSAAGAATTLGQLADATGRPPDHLVAKARELGCAAPDDRDGDEATPFAHPFVAGHYLVHVGAHGRPPPRVVDVLSRHDVLIQDVYRIGGWGFAAHLADLTLRGIAADPDVLEVEPDTEARLAPHRRAPAEDRVPGHYIVGVRRTSQPGTVAARAGVVPDHIFDLFNWFSADLTDAQLNALRRDPEVNDIEDDAVVTLDD